MASTLGNPLVRKFLFGLACRRTCSQKASRGSASVEDPSWTAARLTIMSCSASTSATVNWQSALKSPGTTAVHASHSESWRMCALREWLWRGAGSGTSVGGGKSPTERRRPDVDVTSAYPVPASILTPSVALVDVDV